MSPTLAKKATFWGAVAGTSILANYALEYFAARFPNAALARFTAATHRGAN